MPYCVSKSHCQTVSAASTGIAQASSSPVWASSRTGRDIFVISRATPIPMAMRHRGVDEAEDQRAQDDLPEVGVGDQSR